MQLGDSFLMQTTALGWHQWIVISNPFQDESEKVLITSITTKRDSTYEDHSCVLFATDHPHLQHDSWVYYDRAMTRDVEYLSNNTEALEPMDAGVIARILAGAETSDRIAMKYHGLLCEQGLIAQ